VVDTLKVLYPTKKIHAFLLTVDYTLRYTFVVKSILERLNKKGYETSWINDVALRGIAMRESTAYHGNTQKRIYRTG
jgi:hypothetical protein